MFKTTIRHVLRVFVLFALMLSMGCSKSEPNKRFGVVAMTPALTEIVLDLDNAPQLLATSPFTTDPRAKNAIRIPQNGSLEILTALKPAVVFMQSSDTIQAEKLQAIHIDARILPMTSMSDIKNAMQTIGNAIATPQKTQTLIEEFESDRAKNKAEFDTFPSKPTFLLVIDRLDSRLQQFYIAQHDAFLVDVFEGCGVTVVSSDSDPWKRIDAETLYKLNPQFIAYLAKTPAEASEVHQLFFSRFSGLDAVKNDRLFLYDDPDITIPGSGIGKRQRKLCLKIHEFLNRNSTLLDAKQIPQNDAPTDTHNDPANQ